MPHRLPSAIILVKFSPTAEGSMREIKPYPIVNKLINMFDNWLKHRQEISEMREFDRVRAHRAGTRCHARRSGHARSPRPACHRRTAEIAHGSRHRREGDRTHATAGSPRHGAGLCVMPAQAPVRSRYRGRHLRAALRGILRQRSDHQLTGAEGSLIKILRQMHMAFEKLKIPRAAYPNVA